MKRENSDPLEKGTFFDGDRRNVGKRKFSFTWSGGRRKKPWTGRVGRVPQDWRGVDPRREKREH